MKTAAFVLAGLLAAAVAVSTAAGAGQPSIGLYFDPDCTTCSINTTPGVPFLLYVNVQPGPVQGITGAEFRVVGIPTDWLILDVTPNPAANITRGNPLGYGCDIAFPECQAPPAGCINLYVIRILPIAVHANVQLYISYFPQPDYPNFFCANVVACDAPIYTRICTANGEAWINGPRCTVGVAPRAWGDVKQLYR